MKLLDYLQSRGLRANTGMCTLGDGQAWEIIVNPRSVERTVRGRLSLIVVHGQEDTARMHFDLTAGASLNMIELFAADCAVECNIHQQAESDCRVVSVSVAGSTANYTIDLDGTQAANHMRAAYIAGAKEHTTVALRVNHNVSDCQSDSLVKGVAGGNAVGEFRGLVYVAQDAQRTDAQQQNRNIQLDNSHIVALPQLEIYADDVRCSHGSTVGYSDAEAIFYMRQRGISEADARRLQIEGFVQDVVSRCHMEPVCAFVHEAVADKLSKI